MLRKMQTSHTAPNRLAGPAPLRRPGAVAMPVVRRDRDPVAGAFHPLARGDENARLQRYEEKVKRAFGAIVPALKEISAIQHQHDFEAQAQLIARNELGFELPGDILADAWVTRLDLRRLFAWCVFNTYRQFCDDFFAAEACNDTIREDFDEFLQECGFHTLDISPCADGRMAHLVRYVLRLPPRAVRRKSYAGALFDVEDSIQKWVEIELQRFREGVPNAAHASTRYLKVAAYHFSSSVPDSEGCAAHGSDTMQAAAAAMERLVNFRQAIENSFCCGASIDLLLVGVDTDSDALRVHVPDGEGRMELGRYVDSQSLYEESMRLTSSGAVAAIDAAIRSCSSDVADGMARFIAKLIENNLSQVDYVRCLHGAGYPDIGHAERFIGAGVGFEDIQLRNLMYFAYLDTIEEGAADMDVGVHIFEGLNVAHGLPIPVVVRFDYHGNVPGARERARQRCGRVALALEKRYQKLFRDGLLHILQVARDCDDSGPLEIFSCSVTGRQEGGH